MNSFHRYLLTGIITVMYILLLGKASYAQQDSIIYNSTCTNYKIKFDATIFETITSPDKVIWTFGDPASGIYDTAKIKFPSHAYSAAGKYFVALTIINNGDSTVLKDSITVVDPMPYNFGPDIFLCQDADTLLKAPVIPGATYEWNDDSLSITDTLRIRETGLYTVKINGCAVTDSIGVYFSKKPDIQLGDDHVLCAGEVLTLNAASQNAIYTWKLNGAVLPNDTLAQLQTQAPGGEYIATVNVPGCGIYSDTATITFSSLQAPPFWLGPDTLLCPKQIYPLKASAPGATAYNWSNHSADSMIQISQRGFYWAFVTINGQCQVVDTVEVTYRGDKNLDFHDTAICKGSTLILNADFGTGVYNWVSDPPQRDDQNQTGQSTYYVYEPGLYKVTASVGNCVYTDSLHVSFNDSLKVDIGRDTSLCIGEEYLLHVKTNANTYAWQDGSTANDYAVTNPGTYTLIAQNGCGADTVSVRIDLRHCECQLLMPNAFTPNGDGRNETFRPLHPCKMSSYNLRIFNRYGEVVFQSADPSLGWNGYHNYQRAEPGTYVWAVSYVNSDTNQRSFKKGFVVLIR